MATNASRRSRERKLRAKYRRQTWTVGAIMLIIGLVAGYLIGMLISPGTAATPAAAPTEAALEATPEAGVPWVTANTAPVQEATAEPEPAAAATDEPGLTISSVSATEEASARSVDAPTEAPATDVPATDVPATDVPATEIPATDAPATDVPATDTPATDAPATDVPATDTPATDAPAADAPATDAPATDKGGLVAAAETEAAESAAPEATEAPAQEPIIVPYGEAQQLQTQIKTDGSARQTADADDYETLNLTLKVDAFKDRAYFEETYGSKYSLKGTESAVEFDLTLNDYAGTTEIRPQNFLLISLINADDTSLTQGYQIIDSEIAGSNDVTLTSNETRTLYKRYDYDADQGEMAYMVVSTYVDGVTNTYWFEMVNPNAEAEAAAAARTLTIGSKSEEVTKLQQKLIDMGCLDGSADGKFGNMTAEAVKAAQKQFGMEETGIADAAFLDKLYE